jgi:hypothetical protein
MKKFATYQKRRKHVLYVAGQQDYDTDLANADIPKMVIRSAESVAKLPKKGKLILFRYENKFNERSRYLNAHIRNY